MTPLQALIVFAEVDCVKELVAVDNIDLNATDIINSLENMTKGPGAKELTKMMKILDDAYKTKEGRHNNVENKMKEINDRRRFLKCQEELLKGQKLSSKIKRLEKEEEVENELKRLTMKENEEKTLKKRGNEIKMLKRKENELKRLKKEGNVEEGDSSSNNVDLGKGRNARRKKKKQKQSNEDKVDDATEEAASNILGAVEKLREKVSLLEKKEREEKEKINLASAYERNTLLTLAEQVESTELEKVSLEEKMKEIESELNALLQRKSSIAENQKSLQAKVAAIEKEQTILKQNVAAEVHASEAKIALIQGDIAIAKSSLEKADCKKEKGSNMELEKFLEGQILELEEELECPVCLEVAATSPIYKCPDDHLLCRFLKCWSM